MKEINVVAAVIRQDLCFLATQRGYGEFKGLWEFPGGKVEDGEDREDALAREIHEELQIGLKNLDFLCNVQYLYPSFHLNMDCFLCEIGSGEVKLTEHLSSRWLTLDDLDQLEWVPADVEVVKSIQHYVGTKGTNI